MAESLPEEAHTSVVLHRLIKEAPTDYFTLAWLIDYLPGRSFGVILLVLSMIAMVPFVGLPARLLILILLFQIIVGYQAPALPQRWVTRRLPSRYLLRLERHAIPLLERLETVARPRWPRMLNTKRIAALVVVPLILLSIFAPLPLLEIPPSLICIVISLAYIEHDGLLLTTALGAALALLTTLCMVL